MITKKPIRVLIVDDSIMFRTTLQQKLSADPHIEIVGMAVDPIDAMEKIKQLHPDVLTLDVEMPKMNGIEFLKKLMPTSPMPVVVVSSAPVNALDALQAGAVDFVRKPSISSPADLMSFIHELLAKIKIASTARVRPVISPISAPASSFAATPPVAARPFATVGGQTSTAAASAAAASVAAKLTPPKLTGANSSDIIIAIGASTGGTEAILSVVRNFPPNTPGIVVVQHIPPVFSKMYAQRLNNTCQMEVKEAEDGDRVQRGRIIIGAGEFQMTLNKDPKGYYIRSKPGARVNGHCPSVDVLFESVAALRPRRVIGIILTGMGSDGAKGMVMMRQAGAYTLGQSKESCVVYGMPMMAQRMGGVVKEMALEQIPIEVIRYLNTLD